MSGIDQKNVKHNFDLRGSKAGDWFLGCEKCGQQLPFNNVGPSVCCICGSRMYKFTVRAMDISLMVPCKE